MDEKDIVQMTNDVAKNDDNAKTQPAKGMICVFLDKYIGGIKEYVSLLTFITTISAAIGGAIMRFCSYLYYCGYTSYWNLPKKIIDVKSDNFIFEFIANAILVVFVMIINKFYYDRLKKYRKFWKLFVIGLAYLIISASLYSVFQKYPIAILIYLLITVLFLPAYSITIADTYPNPIKLLKRKISSYNFVKKIKNSKLMSWIYNKRNKKKAKSNLAQEKIKDKGKDEITQKNTKDDKSVSLQKIKHITKLIIIIFFIIAPIIIVGTMWLGYQDASNENSFRVIETSSIVEGEETETFAIIYETDENYYISPCIIENEQIIEINADTKDVITKEGTQYTHFYYKPEK